MKKLATVLCMIGTVALVSACTSTNSATYDSGASYANERTAGAVDSAPASQERTFRATQSK